MYYLPVLEVRNPKWASRAAFLLATLHSPIPDPQPYLTLTSASIITPARQTQTLVSPSYKDPFVHVGPTWIISPPQTP